MAVECDKTEHDKKDKRVRYSFRIPEDTLEELKRLAERGRRPVTHEILWAIEKHIEERRREKPNE